MTDTRRNLEALADLFGIERSYHDIQGREHVASDDGLLALLPRLGARLASADDVTGALRARRLELASRVLEPVLVAWEGALSPVSLRLPEARLHGRFRATVTLESGETSWAEGDLAELERAGVDELEGERFVEVRVPAPGPLPLGHHRLRIERGGERHEALIIAAPVEAHLPGDRRLWGVFAPTYALWRRGRLGGSLAELGGLVERVGALGGQVVGTLPLTPAFLDAPFEPSPYAPVSRLFWNELFLDLEALPELGASAAARDLLGSGEVADTLARLAGERLIDYRALAKARRAVITPMVEAAFAAGSGTREALLAAAERHPRLLDYARFRAVTERQANGFPVWPERLRRGEFEAADLDEAAVRYHVYVQLRMAEQVADLSARARKLGCGLYLDMPLGVHPDGYDAWRESASFLEGCSAGAPPDDLFVGGQDWGFRPLHPERVREDGYRYVVACLRHQLGCAGALRIDHVMGLHRLYCVPWGVGAKQGIYVRYRAEELYALLTLESRRHGSLLVGEDLGTVPVAVRRSMERHRFQRMYVAQFELRHDDRQAMMPVPPEAVASVNTHDTPSFAGFWTGSEIDDRVRLGHLAPEAAPGEHASRDALRHSVTRYLRDRGLLGDAAGPREVLSAALANVGASDARLVLVNLEDLWGEPTPQNVPGTTTEHPNWRQRAAAPLEALAEDPAAVATLERLARARRGE